MIHRYRGLTRRENRTARWQLFRKPVLQESIPDSA